MTAGAVLDDPTWFPHALRGQDIVFVHAAPAALQRASFLDGREEFADAVREVGRADVLRAAAGWGDAPLRCIFHVSFCGSTLLSRLLDVPGRTTVYREPAIQIALADRLSRGLDDAALLGAVTKAFARSVGETLAVVKPTSWANVLLPALTAARRVRPVFVTIEPDTFLVAVFRGGRDRMVYVMRLAQHLAPHVPAGAQTVAAAIAASTDPLRRAANLALTALAFQCALFAATRAALNIPSEAVIDAQSLFSDPTAAARQAARFLDLGTLPRTAVMAHAKAGDRHFSTVDERAANATIERHHGAVIAAAQAWAARTGLAFNA